MYQHEEEEQFHLTFSSPCNVVGCVINKTGQYYRYKQTVPRYVSLFSSRLPTRPDSYQVASRSCKKDVGIYRVRATLPIHSNKYPDLYVPLLQRQIRGRVKSATWSLHGARIPPLEKTMEYISMILFHFLFFRLSPFLSICRYTFWGVQLVVRVVPGTRYSGNTVKSDFLSLQ